jgi:hypothetical protein
LDRRDPGLDSFYFRKHSGEPGAITGRLDNTETGQVFPSGHRQRHHHWISFGRFTYELHRDIREAASFVPSH